MSLFSRILLLVLVALLFTQCSKTGNSNANGSRANSLNRDTSRPGDPGKVEGDDPPAYLVFKQDVDYLQTLPLPQMRFVFRTSTVEMPSGATEALTAHWKKAIKHYYNDYFNKPKDATEIDDRENEWEKISRDTEKKLASVSLPAPDGSRYMTGEEARDSRTFLDQAAKRVVDKVKSINNPENK